MIIYYATLDGLTQGGVRMVKKTIKGKPLLLSYYNVAVSSRATWVLRWLWKGKKQ